MKKLKFLSRSLDDEIVRDGLCGIGTLSDAEQSRGLYFVVGGIASQSYLPSSCRRETFDIDIAVGRPLNHREFKAFSASVKEYLQDDDYNIETRKASRAYHLLATKREQEGETLLIQFARRNRHNFESIEKRVERELSHARSKLVEERDCTYVVSSPEDIIVPKLVRSVNTLGRYPDFERYIARLSGGLSDKKVAQLLEIIREKREEAIYNIGDVYSAEELRFISDLYDIKILSELTGINEAYFKGAIGDWDSIRVPSGGRDKLFRALLPKILIKSSV